MNGASMSTLILTTLLSIVGWLGVTMYGGTNTIRDNQQKLALKVNTLEAKVGNQTTMPLDKIYLNDSTVQDSQRRIKELEQDEKDLDARIRSLETTVDVYILNKYPQYKDLK